MNLGGYVSITCRPADDVLVGLFPKIPKPGRVVSINIPVGIDQAIDVSPIRGDTKIDSATFFRITRTPIGTSAITPIDVTAAINAAIAEDANPAQLLRRYTRVCVLN